VHIGVNLRVDWVLSRIYDGSINQIASTEEHFMAAEIIRDIEDIEKIYDEAIAQSIEHSRYPGSSYEDGVRATLAWFFGDEEDAPIVLPGDGD
jgi:hypothetical protein